MRIVEAQILWFRCATCGRQFPILIFSGDSDYVTAGLISLSSVSRVEVLATEMTAEEWNASVAGLIECERRVNSQLHRKDLRVPIPEASDIKTASLALRLRCLFCEGVATETLEESMEEFREGGGMIGVHPPEELELVSVL